jgi:hypothetical protein
MIALDFLLILLTTTCIVYCMVLNRRIFQIQKYRSEMLKLFKDFDKSIEKAENILDNTKKLLPETEEKLHLLNQSLIKKEGDLNNILENADKLAEELETIIISGNKLFAKLSEIILDGCEVIENHEQNKRQQSLVLEELPEKIKLTQIDYYEILQNKKRHAE